MSELNYKKIANKVADQLKTSGWYDTLRLFLTSEEWVDIIRKLDESRKVKGQWIPKMKDALRWMQLCPTHKMSCVIVTDIEENMFGLNTGVPMSRYKEGKPFILMSLLFDAINPVHYNGSNNLERWCKQGVLMIPRSPTYTIERSGHHNIWRPFMHYLYDKINENWPDIPVIFIGSTTIEKGRDMWFNTPNKHYILIQRTYKKIQHDDPFTKVNEWLKENNMKQIKW